MQDGKDDAQHVPETASSRGMVLAADQELIGRCRGGKTHRSRAGRSRVSIANAPMPSRYRVQDTPRCESDDGRDAPWPGSTPGGPRSPGRVFSAWNLVAMAVEAGTEWGGALMASAWMQVPANARSWVPLHDIHANPSGNRRGADFLDGRQDAASWLDFAEPTDPRARPTVHTTGHLSLEAPAADSACTSRSGACCSPDPSLQARRREIRLSAPPLDSERSGTRFAQTQNTRPPRMLKPFDGAAMAWLRSGAHGHCVDETAIREALVQETHPWARNGI